MIFPSEKHFRLWLTNNYGMKGRKEIDETIEARVRVSREIWRRVRAKAILAGRSVADYVGEILRREVLADETGGKR